MENTGALIAAISGIVIALMSLIGVIINVWASVKTQKIQEQLNEMREESKAGDKKIKEDLEEFMLLEIRGYLIDFMSRIQKNENMNMEQIRIATEKKEIYNRMGGDSYVDDMWDDCKKKGLF